VPPSEWARRVSPTDFPLVLYAVNGVLPIAICVSHGMVWAAVLGAAAMAIPLLLAVRAGAAEGARSGAGSTAGASGDTTGSGRSAISDQGRPSVLIADR